MKKATDRKIQRSYAKLKSCAKVAKKFDMCAQSVYERVKKIGINRHINCLKDSEKKRIKIIYETGFKRGDGKLKKLSVELGRTVPFISRYAKSIGLSNKNRILDEQEKISSSKRLKKWHAENEH